MSNKNSKDDETQTRKRNKEANLKIQK